MKTLGGVSMTRMPQGVTGTLFAWGQRMGVEISPRRLVAWARKGGLAVIDQGLFSGANFLVNILLARWLPPEEYGAFAVALSVFYLLASFHTAVLTEPMMVFGAGKYREYFRKYLGMLLYGHWGIALLIAGGLGAAAFVMQRMGSLAMAKALAGLAVASPFLLLLWLTRRACYVPMRPAWAAAGSGINLVIVLAGVFLLWRSGRLSAFSGLVLLGGGAFFTSFVVLSLALRPQAAGFVGNPTAEMVVKEHWGYGSWNMVSLIAYWGSGQVLMLLIPIFLGLSASAAVAAVWNLYRPVSLFMQSLGLVLLPVFSRWVGEGLPVGEVRRRAMRFILLFGGAVAVYGLFLTVFAKPILRLLYAGRYDAHWLLVGLFGLSTVASMATGMFVLVFKARGKTREVSKVWSLSAVLVGIVSVPLMMVAGLEGAIFGVMVAYSIAALAAYVGITRGAKL